MTHATEKTTRPGGNRNGSETNTEETTPMSNEQRTSPPPCHVPMTARSITTAVAASVEPGLDEFRTLPAAPTILAAPGWATSSTASGEDTAHDYESPVRVGFLADQTDENGAPIVRRCLVALSQIDYHTTEAGRITGTERCPALITIDSPDAWLRLPVAEAEVLHAVVGALLARYLLAESPAGTASGRKYEDVCMLPGCESSHEHSGVHDDCTQRVEVGDVDLDFGGTAHVAARATIDRDGTWFDVVIENLKPDTEGRVEASSAQARVLAARLLEAADRADAIAAGSAGAR